MLVAPKSADFGSLGSKPSMGQTTIYRTWVGEVSVSIKVGIPAMQFSMMTPIHDSHNPINKYGSASTRNSSQPYNGWRFLASVYLNLVI